MKKRFIKNQTVKILDNYWNVYIKKINNMDRKDNIKCTEIRSEKRSSKKL